MVSFLNILQYGINLFLAAVILILLLPFSPHQKMRYYGCFTAFMFFMSLESVLLIPFFVFRMRDSWRRIYEAHYQAGGYPVGTPGCWYPEGPEGSCHRVQSPIVSMFDCLAGLNIWKTLGKCSMVAKKELFYAWPFGLAAWLAGIVFVDRSRPDLANRKLDAASRLITREKTKLWFFPEGTRNKNPDIMMPFKKGAFRMAVTCQVPIIPVVISPYYFIDSERKYFGHGRVIIHCMEPVSTEGKTEKDIDSIMEEVRKQMMKQYEVLKHEVLAQRIPS